MTMSKSTSAGAMRTPQRPQSERTVMNGRPNAVRLLKADHRAVAALLETYEKAHDKEKQSIAQKICAALTVHAQIEEEILYPAAREFLDDADVALVDEADVEHGSIKELIAKVVGSSPYDGHYDATVKVIGEYVKHHVKEEESELFPKLKDSECDLRALGKALASRKAELTGEADDE